MLLSVFSLNAGHLSIDLCLNLCSYLQTHRKLEVKLKMESPHVDKSKMPVLMKEKKKSENC